MAQLGRNCAIPGVGRRLRQAQDKVKGARGWQNLAQLLYELCHNISQSSNLPIRAWHFKAGAVNLFSGLRAPAAPSLTVNTAFIGPVGCYLFPAAPAVLGTVLRAVSDPVVLGPVVACGPAPVAGTLRRAGLGSHAAVASAGHPRGCGGLGCLADGSRPAGHPRAYGAGLPACPCWPPERVVSSPHLRGLLLLAGQQLQGAPVVLDGVVPGHLAGVLAAENLL